MSSVLEGPPTFAEPPRHPSLLRAEARRFRRRRLIGVFVLLGLVGLLAGIAVASTQYAKPSEAGLAQAAQARQAQVDLQKSFRAQCAADPSRPTDQPVDAYCGPEDVSPDQFGPVADFVDKRPFTLQDDGAAGVIGVAAAAAALAFLLGATYVGAEWSTRSMVALLFWEPRRLRVMATKLGVLVGATALLGVVAEGLWLLGARLLWATRGTPTTPRGTWDHLLGSAGRGVVLVVLVGLLGFGIANLLRNTAASFGIAFVYFAVVENVVRVARPNWQPYLFTDNAVALLHRGGLRLYLQGTSVDARGFVSDSHQVLLTNLRGGLVVAAAVAVVVAAGIALFVRRDLD